MSIEFELNTLRVIFFIQAGLCLLFLFRTGIPTLLLRLSSFFWALSRAWYELWDVYSDTLQRTTEQYQNRPAVSTTDHLSESAQ